ncbi:MAG: recombinase A [Planctomycetota bacterium]
MAQNAVNSAAVRRGRDLASSVRSDWSPTALAGRLVELSGSEDSAALTCAFGLVRQAQLTGEPVAWIGVSDESFFPPDVAAGGVDLDALAVVRVPDPKGLARAADQLVRSGGFGLIVLDVGAMRIAMAALSRLLGLAQKHNTAIVFVTDKHERDPSLGSLITLRGQTSRKHSGNDEYLCALTAVKDKRRAPGWRYEEVCGGPHGLH